MRRAVAVSAVMAMGSLPGLASCQPGGVGPLVSDQGAPHGGTTQDLTGLVELRIETVRGQRMMVTSIDDCATYSTPVQKAGERYVPDTGSQVVSAIGCPPMEEDEIWAVNLLDEPFTLTQGSDTSVLTGEGGTIEFTPAG